MPLDEPPPRDVLLRQVATSHAIVMDICRRAIDAGQQDAAAIRLRDTALGLARLHLALLDVVAAETPPEPDESPLAAVERPAPSDPDRLLAGDALSRFVSRRLDPDDPPHDAWQRSLREADPDTPPRATAQRCQSVDPPRLPVGARVL